MAFGVGDELSVKLTAHTDDFERGINSAERSLSGLNSDAVQTAAALQILAGRADEAGDEVSQAGRRAGTTSGLFSTLTASSYGLSFSFGILSTKLSVALLPVLAALSSTLVPLVSLVGTLTAGVTALAGAFSLVIGSGFLAYGQKLANQNKERLEQVNERIEKLETLREETGSLTDAQQKRLKQLEEQKDKLQDATTAMGALQRRFAQLGNEVKDIVVQFGVQFIPLIEDALAAFPRLVRRTLDAVGGMDAFARALRQLGGRAMTVIPQIASEMMDLARNALPVLRDVLGWLGRNAPSIFKQMMQTARNLGPEIKDLAGSLVNALPEINDLGETILNDLIPAVSSAIDTVGNFLENTLTKKNRQRITKIGNAFSGVLTEVEDLVTEVGELIPKLIFISEELIPIMRPALDDLAFSIDKIGDALALVNDKFQTFVDLWKQLPEGLRKRAISGVFKALSPAGGSVHQMLSALRRLQKAQASGNFPDTGSPSRGLTAARDASMMVNIRNLNASGEEEGREAAEGFADHLRSQGFGTGI